MDLGARMARSFVALVLPEDLCDRLEDLQAQLPIGRLMTRDTLHLTLAFLDEQPMDLLEDLHGALSDVTAPPVPVRMKELAFYGSPRRPALGVAVEAVPELAHLQAQVTRAVRQAGLTPERRRFRPHITIARYRAEEGSDPRLSAFVAGASFSHAPISPALSFALYRSQLRAEGAVHDVLADYALR